MKINYYWLCQLIGWIIYGVYDTLVNYLSGRDLKIETPYTFIFIFVALCLTHLYKVFIIKKLGWINLNLKQLLPRVIFSTIVIASILAMYIAIVGVVIKERTAFKFYFFLIFFSLTLLMMLTWNLIYFLWKYIISNTELSIEKIQMESTVKDLELKNIKSNLQPHFIFNALNSIRSLITENQEKARDAVMQLSNILRNSLISDKAELVKLEKELSIVKDYLNLESIRYEERLVVNYTIDKNCLQSLVPPLLLQTLVENAIKHGVGVSPNGGFINFDISDFNNTKTIIKIENTGDYNPKSNKNKEGGFGLESSIKRLFYLFGNYASLTISNSTKNSVITLLEIPK
jgi:two-component system, LytTR family, sensor kinase